MARKSKQFGLKQVEEVPEKKESPTVLRLEPRVMLPEDDLDPEPDEEIVPQLQLPRPEEGRIRSFQPDIDSLIEAPAIQAPHIEQAWGDQTGSTTQIPWGWFALAGLLISGAVAWSLTSIGTAEDVAVKIEKTTTAIVSKEAANEREALALIDKIERTIKKFVATTTIEDRIKLSRQPERVRPLMEDFYRNGRNPLLITPLEEIEVLQPITLENTAVYWMAGLILKDHTTQNLILEVMPQGDIKIDWETYVCYQPMRWDEFASKRPDHESIDFRVIIRNDCFFSHEFKDSSKWNSFQMTTFGSEENVFGYAPVDSPEAKQLLTLISQNSTQSTSVILRLRIPAGLESKNGAIIEKVLSERWIYVNDPSSENPSK